MLFEYGIVAACGGASGASLALVKWAWAGGGKWVTGLLIAYFDLVATVIAAWSGALLVLWQLGRLPPNG